MGGIRAAIGDSYKRHGVYSRKLDRLNRLPLHTAFMREGSVPQFPTRESMWGAVAERCPGPIDYLEFGVHRGHSILTWATLNTDVASRFVGFDTFTGLPETWNDAHPKDHFTTEGRTPRTSDSRVTFEVGLFQDTLIPYLERHRASERQVVVHIDCDLYTSTLYCLTKLDPVMARGTVLIFDEFGDVLHEFRAFSDYIASYRRTARLLCSHDDGYTAAVVLD